MTTLARSTLTFSLTACLSLACGAPESPGSSEEFETVALENPSAGTILRIDPRFDTLVPLDASIEQLASGFVFTEGPVWIRNESRLLFSDVRANGIY